LLPRNVTSCCERGRPLVVVGAGVGAGGTGRQSASTSPASAPAGQLGELLRERGREELELARRRAQRLRPLLEGVVGIAPGALLVELLQEVGALRLDDRAALRVVESDDALQQRGLEVLPRERRRDRIADPLREREHHVARVARVVERDDGRLAQAEDRMADARRGRRVLPPLEIGVVGQDQVGGARHRLVEERAEADDEGDARERRLPLLPARPRVERIAVVEQQRVDRRLGAGEERLRQGVDHGAEAPRSRDPDAVEPRQRLRAFGDLVELERRPVGERRRPLREQPAGPVDRAEQRVQGVHRHRRVQSAAGRELLGPADHEGRLLRDQLARDALEEGGRDAARGGDARGIPLLHEVDEAAVLASLVVAPRREAEAVLLDEGAVERPVAHEQVREPERERPLRAGPRRDPLVGVHRAARPPRAEVDDGRAHAVGVAAQLRLRAREGDQLAAGVEQRRAEAHERSARGSSRRRAGRGRPASGRRRSR
jgi:hypothetical protein